MDILERIREQIRAENHEFSFHAEREPEDEHILVEELEQSVRSGQLLGDYTYRTLSPFCRVWWQP